MRIIFRQTAIRGIAVAPSRAFERMNDFLNQHEIHPTIDKIYPFEQAREAYEHLAPLGRSSSKWAHKITGSRTAALLLRGRRFMMRGPGKADQ